MKPIDKALELRKSLPLRAKKPSEAFNRKITRSGKVLKVIEDQPSRDRSTLFEARRLHVVSMCAAYEAFWRDYLKSLIDSHNIPTKNSQNLKNIRFSFPELSKIIGNELTLGELITCSFSFQSTDIVQAFCKDVFDIDFYRIFAESEFTLELRKSKRTVLFEGIEIFKERNLIDECFMIRHETVHDSGVGFKISEAKMSDFFKTMRDFCFVGSLILSREIEDKFSAN